jgi:hypothetical protein
VTEVNASDRIAQLFWGKVDKSGGDDACWPFVGAKTPKGYGHFTNYRSGSNRAHRIAWRLTSGTDAGAAMVCHRCDNPPCCNPAHLYIGTAVENNRDRVARGRWRGGSPPGERSGRAKLTDASVREIRSRFAAGGVSKKSLAREYGVSGTVIRHVITRVTWRHVV